MLGDCAGCHGKDLAGGVALATPFGNLVTPNITPDKDTGIGNYSRRGFPPRDETGHRAGRQAALSGHALSVLRQNERPAMSRQSLRLSALASSRWKTAPSTSCIFPSTSAL
jgi:hypothetical protein